MNKTTIEWTDYTWNPVTGCNKVSAGCKNCYAENVATRFWGDRDFTDVQMHEDRLAEPEKNKKKWAGKKVFVCSMSDLFHESVSFEFIRQVLVECHWSRATFQILTKRPDRVLQYINWMFEDGVLIDGEKRCFGSNIWLGVSCENQATADERIPLLLQIPAAVRFLSCEPLLGPISLPTAFCQLPTGSNWVIAGGESGHKARPMHPDWVRSLRDQCANANVPFFFKQWGNFSPIQKGVTDLYNGKQLWLESEGKYHSEIEKPFKKGVFIPIFKVGKQKSGNLLDGVEHKAFPT